MSSFVAHPAGVGRLPAPESTPEPQGPGPTTHRTPLLGADLGLVITGRWSRFLQAALEHVQLTELQERNAAVARFFDAS